MIMTEKKSTSRQIIFTDAENSFDVYSNHTGIMTTSYDLKLMFGSVQAVTGAGISVLKHGSVTLSPQHAKAFCRVLSNTIEQFEAKFGKINVVDNPQDEIVSI